VQMTICVMGLQSIGTRRPSKRPENDSPFTASERGGRGKYEYKKSQKRTMKWRGAEKSIVGIKGVRPWSPLHFNETSGGVEIMLTPYEKRDVRKKDGVIQDPITSKSVSKKKKKQKIISTDRGRKIRGK